MRGPVEPAIVLACIIMMFGSDGAPRRGAMLLVSATRADRPGPHPTLTWSVPHIPPHLPSTPAQDSPRESFEYWKKSLKKAYHSLEVRKGWDLHVVSQWLRCLTTC